MNGFATALTRHTWCRLICLGFLVTAAQAKTPTLKIALKNNTPIEQRKKQQIERLAAQYDLKRFTITSDIQIEQGAVAHSKPVLTLNGRFLDSDDRALSQYVHEQGHWVLGRHRGDLRDLYQDLVRAFPGIPTEPPQGSGGLQDSYFHLAVILLEWQALADLTGEERARAVEEFKQADHYTALYKTVLENRPMVESILKRYGVKW
jgi:hypothetical protein